MKKQNRKITLIIGFSSLMPLLSSCGSGGGSTAYVPPSSSNNTVTLPYSTPPVSYQSVSAGGIHTLAIKTDGTLWSWGADDMGQLGDGCIYGQTCNNRYSPGQVGSDNTWVAVSGGTVHSVAIKRDLTLWSWGDNSSGQIGTGCADTTCTYYSTPVKITTDTNWASVSAGGFFTVALKTDGTLWAWGENYSGQLGDGCVPKSTCAMKTTPTQIGTDKDWAMVMAGSNHVLALKTNGTLWAWGDNTYGQLGNGVTGAAVTVPTQIGNDTDWKIISAGDMHSLAIKTGGTLWTWGNDNQGQLGDSCTPLPCTSKPAPTQVGTDTNWRDVDGGFDLSMALKTDGSVWTWGAFSTTAGNSSSVPLQAANGPSWFKVSAGGGGGYSGVGGGHFMAIESNTTSTGGYTLMGWGTNMQGQLGNGTASPVWVPTQVY